MKGFLHNLPQEELDLLLFEYLEGELSEEKALILEERLQMDQLLQDELDSWKETWVVQDFYNTEKVEEQLLNANKHSEKFSFTVSLNSLIVFLLSASLGLMPIKDEWKVQNMETEKNAHSTNSTNNSEEVKGVGQVIPEENIVSNSVIADKRIPLEPGRNNKETTGTESIGLIVESQESLFLPDMERMPLILAANSTAAITTTIDLDHLKSPKGAMQVKRHEINRKEQRKIERKKEKALQDRQAREFMKGNLPYVVPLNSRNF